MAENDGSSKSTAVRPTITLPPRSSIESLFAGGVSGASPGPMTLVSSFFADGDPGSDCASFSQLLAGAMASPVEKEGGGGGNGGGHVDFDFRFRQNRPAGLVVSQPALFTVPPGLSPASLLESPGFFSAAQNLQGPFGMSHQQVLAQVKAQATQTQSQMHIQAEYPSSSLTQALTSLPLQSLTSATTLHRHMSPIPDPNIMKESQNVSHSEKVSQPSSFAVDKPADDGFNWRKYGQKQVKGSEYPRSYYKCTHLSCPVRKKVERSLDGHITEIIYKGQHNHHPPQPSKRTRDTGSPNGSSNPQENSALGPEGIVGYSDKSKEGSSYMSTNEQESSQTTYGPSRSSDSEEVDDSEARGNERHDDEPESKRQAIQVLNSEPASSHRTVTESRIIVQTTSEVDLLDDGYRWRKYGQKVVKGNPYPRSYYKCTSSGCNVRKHVERAASDPKAVITTYEGKHNHDVPVGRNSSHQTAANAASQLKLRNAIADRQAANMTEFGNSKQQPIALLRFKEEQIT